MSARTLLPGAYTATGYRAAEILRRSGRPLPADGSGDRHLRSDREVLGAEGERLERSNFLYETLVNRSEELVLGRNGFNFQAQTLDEDLNAEIEADMARWQRRPEVTGRYSWRECEALAHRAFCNRGDLGVVRHNNRQIRYVESPRICGGRRQAKASRDGGRIEQGVELDSLDRVLAYWVAPYTAAGQIQKAKAKRISQEDMFLFANRKRFSQIRGTPDLVNVFPLIHRLNDILDSEAIAWQQLARLTVLFNLQDGPSAAAAMSAATGDPAPGTYEPPDLAERAVDVEQGTMVWGKPGETVSAVARDLPGANFPQSVETFVQLVGIKSGIPLSVLMLDYRGRPYTAARAELEQAYRTVCRRQTALIEGHHDPITEWFIQWGIEDGRYPEPPGDFYDFYKWSWDPPRFPWIDQLAESKAWGHRIERTLATQHDAWRSLEIDADRYYTERAAEIRKARELAKAISKEDETQPPVDWRIFAGYAVSLNQNVEADEPSKPQQDKGGDMRPRPGA